MVQLIHISILGDFFIVNTMGICHMWLIYNQILSLKKKSIPRLIQFSVPFYVAQEICQMCFFTTLLLMRLRSIYINKIQLFERSKCSQFNANKFKQTAIGVSLDDLIDTHDLEIFSRLLSDAHLQSRSLLCTPNLNI